MVRTRGTWLFAAAFLAVAAVVTAQTTTGTISGHVADSQGLALPGVTISAESAHLQGIRTVTTSENGDYVFTLLPPGAYKVTFRANSATSRSHRRKRCHSTCGWASARLPKASPSSAGRQTC